MCVKFKLLPESHFCVAVLILVHVSEWIDIGISSSFQHTLSTCGDMCGCVQAYKCVGVIRAAVTDSLKTMLIIDHFHKHKHVLTLLHQRVCGHFNFLSVNNYNYNNNNNNCCTRTDSMKPGHFLLAISVFNFSFFLLKMFPVRGSVP